MKRGFPYGLQLLGAFLAVILVALGGMVALILYCASRGQRFAPGSQPSGAMALLMAGCLSGGAALLLGLYLARRLSNPLRQLTWVAAQWQAGKHQVRADGSAPGTWGALNRCLNALVGALEEQENARCQLVADLSHELRAPLAVIQGNLEALLEGIYAPSAETLGPICNEVRALARRVEDLRDLALAEAGQLVLRREPVDLTEMVRAVLAGLQSQAAERGIELPLVLPRAILPRAEVDAVRVRQALTLVISQALRQAPQRGRVEVALQVRMPQWLEVRVRDSGPGIASGDAVQSLGSIGRGDRGQGHLGLAMARRWVEAHGGEMRVESALGQGTTVSLMLPAARP
ncbi:MAG: sensor histidine kinase [Anaerolineae bacterium]